MTSENLYDSWADAGIEVSGSSGTRKVKCPHCHPTRKNKRDSPLSVNLGEGVWHCHNCGWSGGLRKEGGYGQRAPVASEKHYEKPVLVPAEQRRLGPRGVAFLAQRGIDPDVVADLGLYTNGKDDALAIPYTRDGEVIHVKYRGLDTKRFWSTKDTELVMYGLDECEGANTVVLCEGELDRMALMTAGVLTSMSVPNGAINPGTDPGAKLDCLQSAEYVIGNASRIILATDGDEPGQALAAELERRIGPEKCWRVRWPDGCKDANDVLLKSGGDALAEVIDRARPAPVTGLYDGRDFRDELIELYDNGSQRGLTFGYPDFDRHYSVQPGFLTIVTGHSSAGKSTALDQLLIRLADRHDFRTGIFSPEQQPLVRHQQSLIQQYLGKPFDKSRNGAMTLDEALQANEWLAERFAFVLPPEPTVEAILEVARIAVYQRGIQGVVIDPWNEIEHNRPGNMTETEYVAYVLGRIRQFARDHKVHIWLVAHPTKMAPAGQGEEQIPGLMNVSGSVHFRNKADFGLTVYRDVGGEPWEVDIIVTKTRWEDLAQLGRVRFVADPASKRLTERGVIR